MDLRLGCIASGRQYPVMSSDGLQFCTCLSSVINDNCLIEDAPYPGCSAKSGNCGTGGARSDVNIRFSPSVSKLRRWIGSAATFWACGVAILLSTGNKALSGQRLIQLEVAQTRLCQNPQNIVRDFTRLHVPPQMRYLLSRAAES